MSNARAFVLEKSKLNVSQASRFGEIAYVFEPDDVRSSIWSPNFPREVLAALESRDYDPSVDHLVIVGHMVPIVITISELVATYGSIRVLLYAATDQDYVSRVIGRNDDERRRV